MDDKIVELIGRRRNQILVHSCIYYRLNDNIIDDFHFDKLSKELVQLQNDFKEESKTAPLYNDFLLFDGTTGFDLPINDTNVILTAKRLLHYHKEINKGGV